MCMLRLLMLFCFFFFKQKTAYELRISDWSSDVCSSDLLGALGILVVLWAGDHGFGPGRLEPAHLRIGDIHVEMDRGSEILSDPQIGRASCRERVCQYV